MPKRKRIKVPKITTHQIEFTGPVNQTMDHDGCTILSGPVKRGPGQPRKAEPVSCMLMIHLTASEMDRVLSKKADNETNSKLGKRLVFKGLENI